MFIIIIYLRKIFNKEDKIRYREKIFSKFFKPNKNNKKKLIWFHAASIGEVQSIFPLIERLNFEKSNLEFLITTVTLSSGNLVEKRIEKYSNITHRYFPVDVEFLIKRFLYVWKPSLIIFIDSEIWPNLIYEIKKNKIPSMIVNGRITKKTFNRWMLISKFAKEIFNTFDTCIASSNESKDHLKKLNAKNVKYFGNLKLSISMDIKKISNENDDFFKKNKIWCAVSTHRGEEFFCLKTHLNLKKIYKNIVTIIIPRHINRSKEIKILCNKLNLNSQILDANKKVSENKEIIIINSFGSLPLYLKFSKSVFMGKSLLKKLKKVGGQNPIEAAKLGCKVYHGPYTYNFKEIYELLRNYQIADEINNEVELTNKLIRDFKDPNKKNNNMNEILNNLGQKILGDTIKEINQIEIK